MTDRIDVETRIGAIFREQLNREVPAVDTDLFESAILDSLAFVDLLAHLEETFGIRIEPDDFDLDRFRSIAGIAAFIESRRERGRPATRVVKALVDV